MEEVCYHYFSALKGVDTLAAVHPSRTGLKPLQFGLFLSGYSGAVASCLLVLAFLEPPCAIVHGAACCLHIVLLPHSTLNAASLANSVMYIQ